MQRRHRLEFLAWKGRKTHKRITHTAAMKIDKRCAGVMRRRE